MTSPYLEELKQLKADGYRGKFSFDGDAEYEKISNGNWNIMFNGRKPAVIFHVLGSADVSKAILFAKKHHLGITARSGGHSAQGKSAIEGGVLVDLSALKHVIVDKAAKRAFVGTGCLLGDVDAELSAHNLAVTLGSAPITGVGGLALHGGIGLLGRKHGLSMDNIVEVEVVTAAGEILKASDRVNSDLFWGLKGAASNYGIVTTIVFQLYDIAPKIYGGLAIQPQLRVADTIRWVRDITRSREDFTPFVHFVVSPHGPVVASMVAHFGTTEEAKNDLEGLTSLAPVVKGGFGETTYLAVQGSLGPIFESAPPTRQYGKTIMIHDMSDEFIELFVKEWTALQNHPILGSSMAAIMPLGGAVSNIGEFDSPFAAREKDLLLIPVIFSWFDAAHDKEAIEASLAFYHKFDPFRVKKVYINHDNTEILAAHGGTVERLRDIKQKWDPENVFHGTLAWEP